MTKKKKLLLVLKQLTLLFLAFTLLIFIKNETAITIMTLILIITTFKTEYQKEEWKILLLGIIVGFLLETGTSKLYKLKYWSQGMLYGNPLWLPLIWG